MNLTYVDLVVDDSPRNLRRCPVRDVAEILGVGFDPNPICRTVGGSKSVYEHIESGPIMHGESSLHEMRKGMVTLFGFENTQFRTTYKHEISPT